MNRRSSGILLHLTSLPGPFGIGDMGPWAYRFVDFLAAAGQSFWQLLPLTPVSGRHEYSPYHSPSAFAGNPLFISPEQMLAEGWLTAADISPSPEYPSGRVDFPAVTAHKEMLLKRAYVRFQGRGRDDAFDRFCRQHAGWLEDFVLFEALTSHHDGAPWNAWPPSIRDRSRDVLPEIRHELGQYLRELKFRQYLFYRQWNALKSYSLKKHIQIIGDMPIYPPHESADVWAHPKLFNLGRNRRPRMVSGVPPDYFSGTGQLWGHPVYRWDALQKTGYAWWVERLGHQLRLCDVIRIDHFRGLVAYWAVPAREKTAVRGQWVEAPVDDLLRTLMKHFPCLPIVAEDLGTITPDVREVMRRYRLPGMRVLLFAFGDDFPEGDFLPHNHIKHCFLYTGTHDNNTARGWFDNEATEMQKQRLYRYLGRRVSPSEVPLEMIRLAMMSVADTVIVPMQDLLGLGAEARMNDPSTAKGNWHWRLEMEQISRRLTTRLRKMTETYARC